MRASPLEYRLRGFILAAIFAVGFQCSRFDHVSVADALDRLVHVPAQAVLVAGAALALLGALLRTWATAYLSKDVVHDAELRTESVVADGPYRFVRNPLYLALVLLALGYGTAASRLGAVVMVAGVALFLGRLILGEEAALRASQGERYEAFLRAVPRLLPSFRPRLPASGRAPDWKHAWMGEEMFWAFGLGLCAHAWTGRWGIAAVLAAVGIGLRLIERVRAHG